MLLIALLSDPRVNTWSHCLYLQTRTAKRYFAVILCAFLGAACAFGVDSVVVPPNISHEPWNALLMRYVDNRGLVAYAARKENQYDLSALDRYLWQFSEKPRTPVSGDDAAASLINLYNAATIRWILSNYPTESIQSLKDSFTAKRYEVGGSKVSLDDVEKWSLHALLGYRAHAVLVCAARSCPPLQLFAYLPSRLDEQIETAYRVWLGRQDLNRFLPADKRIEISKIFDWYKHDFEKAGGTAKILAQYGPPEDRVFLASGAFSTSYLPYNWGLNDQGHHGKEYGLPQVVRDRLIHLFQ